MLCDDQSGWDVGGAGREVQEGGDICAHIADYSLEKEFTTTPVFLPGESHGPKSLVAWVAKSWTRLSM